VIWGTQYEIGSAFENIDLGKEAVFKSTPSRSLKLTQQLKGRVITAG